MKELFTAPGDGHAERAYYGSSFTIFYHVHTGFGAVFLVIVKGFNAIAFTGGTGNYYNMLEDPLEKRALDVDHLDGQSKQAYPKLEARIASMPGELSFPSRWIPMQFYLYGAGFILAFVVYLIWRPLVRWRRKK